MQPILIATRCYNDVWIFGPPVVAAGRTEAGDMSVAGWLEGAVYAELLFAAGFVCVPNLLGARLVPGRN